MDPDEGLPGVGTPVAEQATLDVLGLEWFAQERVGAKIDHSRRKIIASPPVGIHFLKLFGGKGSRNFSGNCHGASNQ